MEVIFSRGTSILSWLIRRVTGEPVSHCGIRSGEYVIHCNLLGLQLQHIDDFLKHSSILMTLKQPDNYPKLLNLVCKYKNVRYDIPGLIYSGIRLILRGLGIPVPKVNLWQSTGMFLCTEWVTTYEYGIEDGLITPYRLYLKLQTQLKQREKN